jgi:hypothetical protein
VLHLYLASHPCLVQVVNLNLYLFHQQHLDFHQLHLS